MRHRHFSNSFPRFGIDQHDNNQTPVEHSYFPTGRPVAPENGPGPFVGQMNHHQHQMSRGGVQNRNMEISSRTNEYPPSPNITMEIQPFVPTTFSHPPVPENRCLPPGGHAHCTNYNIPSRHDLEAGPIASQGRLKRKRSGSLNNLYTAGSSSTSSSSSQMPMEKPALDCPTIHPYRGSLTIDGPDSSRNVRRRYRHDDDMEPSISRPHLPNHFYQTTPHPPNYSTPLHHPNPDPNPGHWNCAPPYPAPSHRRLSPSDMSGSRHEMSQFHVGGSSGHTSSSQNFHGPHGNHSRRDQSSYGNGSRYSHYAHGGTSGMRTPPESFSSRSSRHCSPGGWRGNYRSGRPRIAVERFHSVLDVTESHDTIGHENNIMMVDRFYGNSRNVSDQYRDLRLDIDNMSYEELLNLEERMGNVNTGLSEDSMSKCLREKVYYSSDQNHEEVSCPICLEEYKDGDSVGTMEKCGHDYHVDCIKKWLLMKKLCPICKTECSYQEQREG